ncbi:MAG: LETM1 domain-containing protein [Crocinitomicaceae bacterium]|nr:LETM1 domain-containing protein [Crocinitomicaceae bacterium]
MILSPGSNGWITKYANLLAKGEVKADFVVPDDMDADYYKHLLFSKSGIEFGFAAEMIFAKELDCGNWTDEERLRLLLFESHLLVFISNGGDAVKDFEKFTDSLLTFYGNHGTKSLLRLVTFFLKENKETKLEFMLSKRTDIRSNIIDKTQWVSHVSNVFVYLDILLYEDFLKTDQVIQESNYEEYAYNAMIALILSVHADGEVEDKEKFIFQVFLNSAHLDDDQKKLAQNKFKEGASFDDFSKELLKNKFFTRFLINISALTIYSSHLVTPEEADFLSRFSKCLKISKDELFETQVMIENFVLNHNDEIVFLQDNSSYEKLYGSVTNKWVKILSRNKDKLAAELRGSKELVFLIKKSTTTELTKEEKEKVKTQFLDIVKSMPALAIFMLPGGALLLPIVLKIIPSLIPSAFRSNEIES